MTTKDDSYIENLTVAEATDKALRNTFLLGLFVGILVGGVATAALLFVTYLLTGEC